jgi:hypothetical protein
MPRSWTVVSLRLPRDRLHRDVGIGVDHQDAIRLVDITVGWNRGSGSERCGGNRGGRRGHRRRGHRVKKPFWIGWGRRHRRSLHDQGVSRLRDSPDGRSSDDCWSRHDAFGHGGPRCRHAICGPAANYMAADDSVPGRNGRRAHGPHCLDRLDGSGRHRLGHDRPRHGDHRLLRDDYQVRLLGDDGSTG